MTMRVCSHPGCGVLVRKAGLCAMHRRQHEQERGSRQARGYGSDHTRRRRAMEPVVATGTVLCARCGKRIRRGQAWDLGHDDNDRSKYRGAEHLECNRGARPDYGVPRG